MYLKDSNVEIPDMYICPLSQELMHDPVLAEDGHTYERKHIKQWLAKHYSSPITHRWMFSKLVDNTSLKDAIKHFIKTENKKYDQKVQRLATRGKRQDQKVEMLEMQLRSLELAKSRAEEKLTAKDTAHAKALAKATADAKAAAKETEHAKALAKAAAEAKAAAKEAEHAKAMGRARLAAATKPKHTPAPSAPPRAMAPRIDTHALEQTACTLCQSKQFDRAIPIFEQLLQAGHASFRFFKECGNALNKVRRPDEAVAMFDKALAIRPDDAYVLKGKGFALKNLKRFQEAFDVFSKVLANNPRDEMATQQVQNIGSRLPQRALPGPVAGFHNPRHGGVQSAFSEEAQRYVRHSNGQVHQAMFFSRQSAQGGFKPSQMFSKHG